MLPCFQTERDELCEQSFRSIAHSMLQELKVLCCGYSWQSSSWPIFRWARHSPHQCFLDWKASLLKHNKEECRCSQLHFLCSESGSSFLLIDNSKCWIDFVGKDKNWVSDLLKWLSMSHKKKSYRICSLLSLISKMLMLLWNIRYSTATRNGCTRPLNRPTYISQNNNPADFFSICSNGQLLWIDHFLP